MPYDPELDAPEVKAKVAAFRKKLQQQRINRAQSLITDRVCTMCNRTILAGNPAALARRMGAEPGFDDIAIRIAVITENIGDIAILCGQCDSPNDAGTYDMVEEMLDYYSNRVARNDYGIPEDATYLVTYSAAAMLRRGLPLAPDRTIHQQLFRKQDGVMLSWEGDTDGGSVPSPQG